MRQSGMGAGRDAAGVAACAFWLLLVWPGSVMAESPALSTVTVPASTALATTGPATTEPIVDEGEIVILDVTANARKLGPYFVKLLKNGTVEVEPDLLRALRIQPSRVPSPNRNGRIPLAALAPDIAVTIDTSSARLLLEVAPSLFEPQRISARPEETASPTYLSPERNAGFINYGLWADYSDSDSKSAWTIPLEVGWHHREWLVTSEWRHTTDDSQTLRYQSTLTREWPERLQRLSVGDITPRVAFATGLGQFGGVAFEKAYEMDPAITKHAGLATTLTLSRPSTVELFQDGRSVRKLFLESGVTSIEDILQQVGSGALKLEITDVDGKRDTVDVPYYISASSLKPGFHEYGYYIGMPRKQLGIESNDYASQPVFFGNHRYGFEAGVTSGLQWQFDQDVANFGPSFNSTLFGHSELAAQFNWSHSEGENAGAGRLDYIFRAGRVVNVSVGVEAAERHYATLSTAINDDKVRFGVRTNVGFSLGPKLGSLSLGYAKRDYWLADNVSSSSVNYGLKLSRGLHLNLAVNMGNSTDDMVLAYLIYSPPANRARISSAVYTHEFADPDCKSCDSRDTLDIRSSYPRSTGYWYGGRVSAASGDTSAQISLGDKTHVGTFSLDVTSADANSLQARFSGGVAITPLGAYPTRPIRDSFGVVTTGLPGIPVKLNNNSEPEGRTSKSGVFVLPELTSYGRNTVGIDARAIPIDYTLLNNVAQAHVRGEGRRWGAHADFQIQRFTAFEGKVVFLDATGKTKAMENGKLLLSGNGRNIESFTGDAGYFYLENMMPGSYDVKLTGGQQQCHTQLDIPTPNQGAFIINIGEIICSP